MCGIIAAMDGMTQEEAEEFNRRLSQLPRGASEVLAYPTRQRLNLIANLIVDRIIEDQKNGAPLLRKIEQQERDRKADSKK